jgi:hypothetical protein
MPQHGSQVGLADLSCGTTLRWPSMNWLTCPPGQVPYGEDDPTIASRLSGAARERRTGEILENDGALAPRQSGRDQ